MFLFRYLLPQTVLRTSSRYNPDIRVVREWRGLTLLVNGSRQSGQYIRKLWQRAFGAFDLQKLHGVRSILVLGVGGGTVIELLAAGHPRAVIIGVDRDQTMIDIAKQYFHLDQISRLRLLHRDANEYIHCKKHFDLIVIDLFIGREIPSFVSTVSFYQKVKKILGPGSLLVVNYLREREYQKKSDTLFLRLKRIFPELRDFPVANNRFFFCRS